jgi:hypothetical protein
MALTMGLVILTIALLGQLSTALTIPNHPFTLVILTIAFLGGPSTALTISEVIITLSLLTQQNDGTHDGPSNPDHRSPWPTVNSSNYS